MSSSVSRESVKQTTLHPASVQQYSSTSSSKSLDGFVPIRDKSGVRPTSSSRYDTTPLPPRHHAQQDTLILLKMQLDATSNVLVLATGYAAGYGLCNRHSAIQWLCRAAMLAIATVLYVAHDSTPDHPYEMLPLLAITFLVDVYDQHTDAISVLKRTMVPALIARLYGGTAVNNGLLPSLYAFCFVAVHHIVRDQSAVPAANALATYLACVMPQAVLPFEAFLRLLGACVIMYVYRDLPVPLQSYTVVHFFIAPWPVACIVAVYQVGHRCYQMHDVNSSSSSHPILV